METPVTEELKGRASQFCYQYEVYGVGLRTSFPLSLPERSTAGLIEIDVSLPPHL